jgi:colanic acid biosynthesis glycosyl transferase WcaI
MTITPESPASGVLLLNQSGGPSYWDLVQDVALAFPGSLLYTGSDVHLDAPHLESKRGPAYDRRSRLSRAMSWGRFLLGAGIILLTSKRRMPALVVSNPPMLPWLAAIANVLIGRKFILLVYDVYPDVLVGLGLLGERNPVTRLWRLIERFTRSRAAAVVAISPRMLARVALNRRRPAETIIPTWADVDRFKPLRRNENPFAREHGISDGDFVVMYSGNIGYTHDIEAMIRAAAKLTHDDVRFFVIGDGGSRKRLEELASDLGAANVRFLPPVPAEMLPFSLAAADVSVVSIASGFEGISMPSKTYFAMAVGSALLGLSRRESDLASLIIRHECGLNVEPDDVEGTVEAIRRLRGSIRLFQENSRRAAIAFYSLAPNTEKFVRLIRDVAAGSAGPPAG